jgi:hypothetical protein
VTVFGLSPSSGVLKTTTHKYMEKVEKPCNSDYKTQRFENWICFRHQVRRETPTLLGPLERANFNK